MKKSLYDWCIENDRRDLIDEWHSTKNGELTSHNITFGTQKKVWWKCQLGHEWEAVIANRVHGNNCPYCSGQWVKKGINDLMTTNPQLAVEWDLEKNGDIRPENIKSMSGKKVWWLCNAGHSYQMRVCDRTNGSKCPVCLNRKVLQGFNDLATINPILAEQWHPTKNGKLMPKDVTCASGKKIWWLCPECGCEWETDVAHRATGRNCPCCALKKRSVKRSTPKSGVNDLATICPSLIFEWNYDKNTELTPNDVTYNSSRKVWWKCGNGHEWEAVVSSRYNGNGCPICANQKILVGYNDLATINPELASEWHSTKNNSLTPNDITCKSGEKVWWQCDKGHEWEAAVSHRTNGTGCPTCAGKIILDGFNDLATISPELAEEWHPVKNGLHTPNNVYAGGVTKYWWMCSKGHEWQASIDNRIRGKTGCPFCNSGRSVSFPEKAIYYYIRLEFPNAIENYHEIWLNRMEIDIYIPIKSIGIEYDGENWHREVEKDLEKNKLCDNNGVSLIRIREKGCPPLATGTNFYLQNNGLTELEKAIEMLLKYLGAKNSNVNIKRDEDRIRKLIETSEVNSSLHECFPELVREWHPYKNGDLLPTHVYAKTARSVWWQCSNGHEWRAAVISRANGIGCPICSNKKLLKGYNDLATTHPNLAREWHPSKNASLQPSDVFAGSGKNVWWLCQQGHEYITTPNKRSGRGSGCPICAGKKTFVGYNDLASLAPLLAQEWHPTRNDGLTPRSVTAGSNKKVWWKCSKGHEWESTISNRKYGKGCPFCAKENRRKKD